MRTTLVKRIAIALLVCCAPTLSGCDEEAQQYASELGGVLKSYHAQVERKINAEQESYKKLTEFYAHAQEQDILLTLALERNRRSRELAEEYVGGEKSAPSGAALRGLLREFATLNFEQTKAMLEDESEARTRFLTSLEELEVESAKVESLGKALDELAKPKRPLRQLREFVNFANEVDKGIQALACEGLAREIRCTEKQIADEKDEKDEKVKQVLAARLARLQSELDGKNCSVDMSQVECPDN
jgi:hypothetical protein